MLDNGLLGNSREFDYLRSENERLQNKVLIIQAEYDLEKTKSDQLKDVVFIYHIGLY